MYTLLLRTKGAIMRLLSSTIAIIIGITPTITMSYDPQPTHEDINNMAYIVGTLMGGVGGYIYNTGIESSIRYIRDEVSPDTDGNLDAYLDHELFENGILMSASTLITTLLDRIGIHIQDLIIDMLSNISATDHDIRSNMVNAGYTAFYIARAIHTLHRMDTNANQNFHPHTTPEDPEYYIQARAHRDRNNIIAVHGGTVVAHILQLATALEGTSE